MSTSSSSNPTPDEVEEVLLSCRYGEMEEVAAFVQSFGVDALASAVDERGNTCLHHLAGNAHAELLAYLLPKLPSTLFSTPNSSGSTPLHWAALNGHLPIAKALVLVSNSPGDSLIDIKNDAGRTAVGEAEMMERNEVAQWLVGRMLLGDEKAAAEPEQENMEGEGSGVKKGGGEEEEEGEEEDVPLFKLKIGEDGSMEAKPLDS